MLELLLRVFLAYVTFVRPVMYGAQLCKKDNPDPKQVTNVTLALVFSWLMELADMLFLSSFIAARSLYMAARVVLCLYFSHPGFLGALRVYEKIFAPLVDAYGPMVDSLIVQHIETIGHSGIMHYCTTVGMSLFRVVMEVVDIAKRLVESTADTEVPAAPLPRRLSVGHAEPVCDDDVEAGEELGNPENQYVTPSIVAKVRRTASERGFPSLSSTPSPPPSVSRSQQQLPQVLIGQGVTWDRDDDVLDDVAMRPQPSRRPPIPPPSPPLPSHRQRQHQHQQQQQRRPRSPYVSDEEDYYADGAARQAPPPGSYGHEHATTFMEENYYRGEDYGYH